MKTFIEYRLILNENEWPQSINMIKHAREKCEKPTKSGAEITVALGFARPSEEGSQPGG